MRWRGIALCAGVFSLVAATAMASTPRRLAEYPSSVYLHGDGSRWVAWPEGKNVDVYDGARQALSRFAFPGADCTVAAVGGGHMAIGCRSAAGERRLLVRDLASGRTVTIRGATTTRAIRRVTFDELGEQWLGGFREQLNSPPIEFFVNWHTGEVRRGGRRKIIPDNQTASGDLVVAPAPIPSHDLDAPRLRAIPWPAAYLLQAGARRCGLFLRRAHRSDAQLVSCEPSKRWDVPVVSPGLATWQSESGVGGYVLASGRRLAWSFPDLDLQLGPSQDTIHTAHTRSEVLFSVAHYGANASRYSAVYAAPWRG